MPIKIFKDHNEEVAFLCNNNWELPVQLEALEKWLENQGKNITKASYIADIGFSPREGAAGGGYTINTSSMEIMISIGMKLCLSEYPEFLEEN